MTLGNASRPGDATDRAIAEAIGFHQSGRISEAEAIYKKILDENPKHALALQLLGVASVQLGRVDEAITLLRESIKHDPRNPDAYNNLGEALRIKGEFTEAIEAFKRAFVLNPQFPEALSNMGIAHAALGQHEFAIHNFHSALALRPDSFSAQYHLGRSLLATSKPREAIDALQAALKIAPAYAEAHYQLGLACQAIVRDDLAVTCLERTLALAPEHFDARVLLAMYFVLRGRNSETVDLLREARAHGKTAAPLYTMLGAALANQGKLDEALTCIREGVRHNPDDAALHSDVLFTIVHEPGVSRETIWQEHLAWANRHATKLYPAADFRHPTSADANRKLRIGYVSPDLRNSVVGIFLEPILATHDRNRFFVKCYARVPRPDQVTARMQASVDDWTNCSQMSDDQLAEQIREDQIDILIDLAVHSAYNSLLVFVRKPAPVQISYLGYPSTTGLSTMDYRVSDVHMDPPGLSESFNAEKLIRLPDTYFCYPAPRDAPAVAPPPSITRGAIHFGSFNRMYKVNDQIVELWSRVLQAVPKSKLILKGMGLGADQQTREYQIERFERHGILADRLVILEQSSLAEYFAELNDIDIALDTFPFGGGTTSCHVLWMGVPMITLAYDSTVGRIGLSLLENLGLGELVAKTQDEYLAIATELARDTERLARLRSTLRDRMRASPLMDQPRFTRYLESAYRLAWINWCEGKPPHHIEASDIQALEAKS